MYLRKEFELKKKETLKKNKEKKSNNVLSKDFLTVFFKIFFNIVDLKKN